MSCGADAKSKLWISVLSALIFFIIASPFLFSLVDKLFGSRGIIVDSYGKPTVVGVAVHAVVFFLVVYLLMQPWKKSSCKCVEVEEAKDQ